MNSQPYVYIVDDDYAVRDAVGLILDEAGFSYQVFENAETFLESYTDGQPGCLLLDINMPGMKGDELQAELNRRNIGLPIIFLTAYGDIPMTVRTIKAGAVDFLTKPVPKNSLIDCIKKALQHANGNAHAHKSAEDFQNSFDNLTSRELEILPLALQGMPNKEIAQILNISYRTVEIHRINILKKTKSTNFLELATKCDDNSIFQNLEKNDP